MDCNQVLRDLDELILPGGAVVLASGGAPGELEPAPWLEVVADVRTHYLGPERRAGSARSSAGSSASPTPAPPSSATRRTPSKATSAQS